jgi:hypothetical protein
VSPKNELIFLLKTSADFLKKVVFHSLQATEAFCFAKSVPSFLSLNIEKGNHQELFLSLTKGNYL